MEKPYAVSRITTLLAAALVVGLATTSAQASLVGDVQDLNDIDLGNQVANQTENWQTVEAVNGQTVGELESTVFDNDGLFTYAYEVRPEELTAISEFNTGFAPLGFTGTAGWDFDQAGAAGGVGDATDFDVIEDADGTIDWEVTADQSWWNSPDPVTFFYQSTYGPGPKDVFNMIDQRSASALGIAPIPEPASASLLGVLGLAMLRRRRRNKV